MSQRLLNGLAVLTVGMAALSPATAQDLHPCHAEGLREPARCATTVVPENRDSGSGRTLLIATTILPARQRDRRPDPLVLFAGGPGQAASDLARLATTVFADVQRTRDIVLIDARGTGHSNPLRCPWTGEDLLGGDTEPMDVAACLATLESDPRYYTNEVIADDVADILTRLGYGQVNTWGGSFGTRAALVFARRHPERVRSTILDANAPFELAFPSTVARDAQLALDLLFDDCARDPRCSTAFPTLRDDFRHVIATLRRGAQDVRVRSPRSGKQIRGTLSERFFSDAVRLALYSPRESSLLPFAIRAARRDDYAPLVAITSHLMRASVETMSIGATLSILCSEDLPASEPRQAVALSQGTFVGDHFYRQWEEWCGIWPKGRAPDRSPRILDIPALVISGQNDPVTPPAHGAQMLRSFQNGRHLIVPGAAHNASLQGCLPRLMAEFIESASPQQVDASCLSSARRPPFVADASAVRAGNGGAP